MRAHLRISVISDEISQELAEAISLAKKHNFNAIEIRSVWGKNPLALDQFDCERVLEHLHKAGLAIAGFASPTFKTDFPESAETRDSALAMLEQSLQIAKWLNAPVVRVFSFLCAGEPNPAAAADAIREILSSVSNIQTTLVVETGTRTNTPCGQSMAQFMHRLGVRDVGVLWDPANSVFSGRDACPFPNSYEALVNKIRHVHVKDPAGTRCYVRLGDGDIPWSSILQRLSVDGFPGFVSLETHWRCDKVLTPAELDNAFGYEFSEGGYAASDICMDALLAMLSDTTHESK